MKTKILILTAFLLFLAQLANAQGYEIKVKIEGISNQDIILGHYFSDRMIPDDTARVDANGVGVFKGNKPLPQGMYLVFLPNKSYFDIFIDNNQNFSVENGTENFVHKFKQQNTPVNAVFYEYQLFLNNKSTEANQLKKEKEGLEEGNARIGEIDNRLQQLDREVRNELDQVIANNSDNILGAFLLATKEVQIPKTVAEEHQLYYYLNHYFDNMPLSDERLVRSPLFERKLKSYLDFLNRFEADTIIKYVEKIFDETGVNNPAQNKDKELFRMALINVHNHFASSQIMGHDAVFVHVAEKHYLPKAHWSDAEYTSKLKENIAKKKTNLIGQIAPRLVMQQLPADKQVMEQLAQKADEINKAGFQDHYNLIMQKSQDTQLKTKLQAEKSETKRNRLLTQEREKETKTANEQQIEREIYQKQVAYFQGVYNEIEENATGNPYPDLHQITAKNIIVWFWEPDCSHCKKATPVLSNFYKKYNQLDMGSATKNLEVYAVYLPRGIEDWGKFTNSLKHWFDFVNENNLTDWINAWDPYGETNFRTLYDIYSSPVPYLLDEQKKIIAKRVEVESLRRVLLDQYVGRLQEQHTDNNLQKELKKTIELFNAEDELKDWKEILSVRLKGNEKEAMTEYVDKLLEK